MSGWREIYKDKIMTPEQVVSHVQSGDKIIFGDWLGEPPALVQALVGRAQELRNVEIIHGMSPGPHTYLLPEYQESFHHTALFLGGKTRKLYKEGKIDYIGGTSFHKWPDMFAKSDVLNPHWAFICISEPDENGDCSYGVDCSFTEPAVRTAKTVAAQINPNMPYVGGKKINLKDIDYITEKADPLYTIGRAKADEITEQIAKNVASLVEDGATLQLGIGSLPDAIAGFLKDKKDLGIHSETLTESMMDLVKAGVITNKCKTIDPGVCVGSQAAGSEEFFRYIDKNPMFAVMPVDYVNDPYIVGKNNKMTSINATIEVNLLGEANSESIGGHQYSGIGGQLDHVRGSQLSKGGKSIIALASTAKHGEVSKIVPYFAPGTPVTVSRYDINYVVTEYGIADLKYKTVRQRAEALIAIAHPKFREQLRSDAVRMGLIPA